MWTLNSSVKPFVLFRGRIFKSHWTGTREQYKSWCIYVQIKQNTLCGRLPETNTRFLIYFIILMSAGQVAKYFDIPFRVFWTAAMQESSQVYNIHLTKGQTSFNFLHPPLPATTTALRVPTRDLVSGYPRCHLVAGSRTLSSSKAAGPYTYTHSSIPSAYDHSAFQVVVTTPSSH